jgi:hypothetical protein
MEAFLNAIQHIPLTTILILAGLLFLLLGFVTKLGGFIEVSSEQKRWAIPTGLFVLTIGLALYLKAPSPSTTPAPASASSAVTAQPEATNISNLPASTYQDSCDNLSISGNSLVAYCRTKSGDFVQSSIVLRGIDNVNGVLTATNFDRPSTYQHSCDNISISRNVLTAFCETGNGKKNQTTISLSGIGNDNGVLVYPDNQ